MKLKIPHPKTVKFLIIKFLYRFSITPSITYEGGIFYYDPTSIMGEKLYWMGGSELKELAQLKTFLKSDSVAIDIGSNVGGHAIAFAATCPQGKVFAFEPQPNTFKILKRNIKHFSNAFAFPYALSNKNGEETFYQTADSGYSTIINEEVGKTDYNSKYIKEISHYNVTTRTLDDLIAHDQEFKDIKKIDLIKIDVEGAEEKVIHGALETIRKFNPVIMCEINGGDGSDVVFRKVKKISSHLNPSYKVYIFKDKLVPFESFDAFYYNYFFVPY